MVSGLVLGEEFLEVESFLTFPINIYLNKLFALGLPWLEPYKLFLNLEPLSNEPNPLSILRNESIPFLL